METITCPYCESKVNVSAVETDDGTCPECGAPLMGSLIFDTVHADDDDPYEEGEGHLSGLDGDDDDDL
jgi:DNA-directed RNA polymerase subunit RPC12/RpoP